jgi:serine protease Do
MMRPPTPARGPARRQVLALCVLAACGGAGASAGLPDLIERIRPSVHAVGFYRETQNPRFSFRGTGFAVGDGSLLVTNAHVIAVTVDSAAQSQLMVNVREPGGERLRRAQVVAQDNAHDLVLLRVEGAPLSALPLRQDSDPPLREGQGVAFTGYPMGMALGLAPVTHRGIISAIRPVAIPSPTASHLDARTAALIREGAFELYQLDATAYPGNSGGPLFHAESGVVVGVVNMVTLKGTRESALTQPSGISYAIPVRHVRELMARVAPR